MAYAVRTSGREQRPEAQGSFGAQSIRRPGEAFELLGESRRHVRDMELAVLS